MYFEDITLRDCVRDSEDVNYSPLDLNHIKNLTFNNVKILNHQRSGVAWDGGAVWLVDIEYLIIMELLEEEEQYMLEGN